MRLLKWLTGKPRSNKGRRGSGGGRRGSTRRRSPYKTAVAQVQRDLSIIEEQMARHDSLLADLEEKTTDERLEEMIEGAVRRFESRAISTQIKRDYNRQIDLSARSMAVERRIEAPTTTSVGLQLTPNQLTILEALAVDGGDRFLSYKDIGKVVNKSPGAVKTHINEMKKRRVPLEAVTSLNNEARYKISSELKRLLAERHQPSIRAPVQDGAPTD